MTSDLSDFEALADLYPLPDGLHFTPAMSARAVMQRLRIIEVPMAYSERVGESKLRAVKGWAANPARDSRCRVVLSPARMFTLCFSLCALGVLLLAISPVEFYFRNPGVVESFTTRHVTLHWSRVIVAAFGFLIATECVVTASLLRIVGLWKDFLASSQTKPTDDRRQATEDHGELAMTDDRRKTEVSY